MKRRRTNCGQLQPARLPLPDLGKLAALLGCRAFIVICSPARSDRWPPLKSRSAQFPFSSLSLDGELRGCLRRARRGGGGRIPRSLCVPRRRLRRPADNGRVLRCRAQPGPRADGDAGAAERALAASARWPCARRARRARGASLPRQHFLCAKGQCLCVAALTAPSSHAPSPSRAARRFARHRRAHLPGRCVCAPTFVAADVVANARAARFTAISTPAFCPASPPSCPPNAHEQAWPLPTSSRCLGRLLSRRSLARLRWRRQPARGWRRLSSCAAGN